MKLQTFAAALFLLGTSAYAQSVAIVNAKAWTLTTDAPTDNATIIITEGKVASVSAATPAPAGVRVIDAGGKVVTPGLMHPATRLGLIEVSSAAETVDHVAKAGGDLGRRSAGTVVRADDGIDSGQGSVADHAADGAARSIHAGGQSTTSLKAPESHAATARYRRSRGC